MGYVIKRLRLYSGDLRIIYDDGLKIHELFRMYKNRVHYRVGPTPVIKKIYISSYKDIPEGFTELKDESQKSQKSRYMYPSNFEHFRWFTAHEYQIENGVGKNITWSFDFVKTAIQLGIKINNAKKYKKKKKCRYLRTTNFKYKQNQQILERTKELLDECSNIPIGDAQRMRKDVYHTSSLYEYDKQQVKCDKSWKKYRKIQYKN